MEVKHEHLSPAYKYKTGCTNNLWYRLSITLLFICSSVHRPAVAMLLNIKCKCSSHTVCPTSFTSLSFFVPLDCSCVLSRLLFVPYPASRLLSVQALLNTPLFHMLLLCNFSSTLWLQRKPDDLFMLMEFPCTKLDPSFPTVSSYWVWPKGLRAPRYMTESWHCQLNLSRSYHTVLY